ncbi:MAG: shikimate dehydrogenase [Clostridia bacterium]|nr:shikimate dehydrogenase [Clostridia bacterium]
MEYGLIGEKLGHSFSKEIHGKIGDYDYRLKELAPDALSAFLTEGDFKGINVTIPYKKDVIPYLYAISPEAEAIGAVNTVVNRAGKLYGYNTDYIGLKRLILRITKGQPLAGKVLILGTGGTSLTANAVVKDMGATPVIVSRSGKDGAITYEEALRDHTDASFLINTTPVGMYPRDDGMAVDPTAFPQLKGVADAVYNPLRTPLVRRAKGLGIPAEGGLYMLVAQAVAAYGFFFDTEADEALTDRIYCEVQTEKENIVLIGMPASGKSTVGKALAESLSRPFYDSDEEIVKEAGMPIPDFFAKCGEAAFRDLESRVIARLSSGLTGAVIATGGGAVLRSENVDRLKANGRLFWLDRSLEKLIPTSDRPLSSDREALTKRYEERYPIYRASCDVRIDGDGAVEDVAEAMLRTFA